MITPDLLTSTGNDGARVRTITNQIAMTLRFTKRPATKYQLKANQCIREARQIREQYDAGKVDVNEAEAKLNRLMLEALSEKRNERKVTGDTPMLLPPEDTGYLL